LDDASYRAFGAEPDDDAKLDARGLFQGLWAPSEPIAWRHYMGGASPKDLVPTGYGDLFLVSDRVVAVLRQHGFSGWTTYLVTLYGKKKEPVAGYHGFSITGRCGLPDESRTRLEWRDPLVPNGPRVQVRVGLYVDLATWTGEEVFSPHGSGWCFVTEPVKVALEKAKVTNLKFVRLSEYEQLVV